MTKKQAAESEAKRKKPAARGKSATKAPVAKAAAASKGKAAAAKKPAAAPAASKSRRKPRETAQQQLPVEAVEAVNAAVAEAESEIEDAQIVNETIAMPAIHDEPVAAGGHVADADDADDADEEITETQAAPVLSAEELELRALTRRLAETLDAAD